MVAFVFTSFAICLAHIRMYVNFNGGCEPHSSIIISFNKQCDDARITFESTTHYIWK